MRNHSESHYSGNLRRNLQSGILQRNYGIDEYLRLVDLHEIEVEIKKQYIKKYIFNIF